MYEWTKNDKKELEELMSSDDTSSTVDTRISFLVRKHGEHLAHFEGVIQGVWISTAFFLVIWTAFLIFG